MNKFIKIMSVMLSFSVAHHGLAHYTNNPSELVSGAKDTDNPLESLRKETVKKLVACHDFETLSGNPAFWHKEPGVDGFTVNQSTWKQHVDPCHQQVIADFKTACNGNGGIFARKPTKPAKLLVDEDAQNLQDVAKQYGYNPERGITFSPTHTPTCLKEVRPKLDELELETFNKIKRCRYAPYKDRDGNETNLVEKNCQDQVLADFTFDVAKLVHEHPNLAVVIGASNAQSSQEKDSIIKAFAATTAEKISAKENQEHQEKQPKPGWFSW